MSCAKQTLAFGPLAVSFHQFYHLSFTVLYENTYYQRSEAGTIIATILIEFGCYQLTGNCNILSAYFTPGSVEKIIFFELQTQRHFKAITHLYSVSNRVTRNKQHNSLKKELHVNMSALKMEYRQCRIPLLLFCPRIQSIIITREIRAVFGETERWETFHCNAAKNMPCSPNFPFTSTQRARMPESKDQQIKPMWANLSRHLEKPCKAFMKPQPDLQTIIYLPKCNTSSARTSVLVYHQRHP